MVQEWIKKLSIKTRANVPIATQLAEQIKWFAAADIIRPGEQLPSIRKLAKNLSISLHTVRAAYTKLESIGLVETIQSQGSMVKEYNPVTHSERFSDINTNTIGILVPDLKNPFYTQFLMGVERVARKEKYITTAYNTQGPFNSRISDKMNLIYKNMLLAQGIEGLLVGPFEFQDEDSLESVESYFNKLTIPVVFVDRPEVKENVVNLDAMHAGLAATEHLIEHDHKKIGLITGKRDVPTLNNCYAGYKQALEKHGIDVHENYVKEVNDFSFAEGYHTCKRFLTEKPEITALFIASDILATGAIRAMHEMRITIPDDIAVIGYNNIDQAVYTIPSLTTVATPTEELGEKSIMMLIDIISGNAPKNRSIMLPTTLIIRESCGCTAKNKY